MKNKIKGERKKNSYWADRKVRVRSPVPWNLFKQRKRS
jgi:hypothetical protein